MEFMIDSADALHISDLELSELLSIVFVDGGYTEAEVASTLFAPSSVRNRGLLIGARDKQSSALAGIVIIVPPDSSARRLAQDNETEMHLLGVMPKFRGFGLGRLLVEAAIKLAKQRGYSKMILWTQTTMIAAQRLYESSGFIYTQDIRRTDRDFLVYESNLCD